MKKPLPTIGVDKYTVFKMKEDTQNETTYDAAVEIPGTVEISPTDSGGSDVFDADNGAYDVCSYIEKIGHEITNADITPEIDAMLRGAELKNGVLEIGNDSKSVYFGVAWRILKSDGTYRYIRYYKGVYSFASNVGGKTKPSEGAPERQTAKATYTAAQRMSDGKYYAYIDEEQFITYMTKEAFEEKWFSDLSFYPIATPPVEPAPDENDSSGGSSDVVSGSVEA